MSVTELGTIVVFSSFTSLGSAACWGAAGGEESLASDASSASLRRLAFEGVTLEELLGGKVVGVGVCIVRKCLAKVSDRANAAAHPTLLHLYGFSPV